MTFLGPGFHEAIPSGKGRLLYFLREGQSLQGVGWGERKRENSASTVGGGVVHHRLQLQWLLVQYCELLLKSRATNGRQMNTNLDRNERKLIFFPLLLEVK